MGPCADTTLHAFVAAQVARTPAAVAIHDGHVRVRYDELAERAAEIGRALAGMDLPRGALVGILLPPGADSIAGMLGAMEAGHAFVHFDPATPAGRLAFMVRDSGARPVLCAAPDEQRVAAAGGRPLVLDSLDSLPSSDPVEASDGLAYVVYTSGSSGSPLAVMIGHAAIVGRLRWEREALPMGPGDVVLQIAPPGFDAYLWEVFAALGSGACLAISRTRGTLDLDLLVETIVEAEVTVISVVPSLLARLLAHPEFDGALRLRRVISSGEVLDRGVLEGFFAKLRCELLNFYGPTEVAIDGTCWVCHPGERMPAAPAGRAVAGLRVVVVDERLRPVAPGEIGEIVIAGLRDPRGYLGDPRLTAERFVPDPEGVDAGGVAFRTGDLGYLRREDGALIFAGRRDGQIKRHGVRIEPAEIEARLRGVVGVAEAAVINYVGSTVLGEDDFLAGLIGQLAARGLSLDDLDRALTDVEGRPECSP